jgi:glycerol-3-phosphate cytidylyltransferase
VFERWVQLKNCSWVDEIIPYDTETDLINLIATTPINKRFLGEDYLGKLYTAEELCAQLNIEIIFLKRRHNFSSTDLRNRVYDAETKSRISRP